MDGPTPAEPFKKWRRQLYVRFFELEFLFGRGQGYSQSKGYANCYFGTHLLITLFVDRIFLLNYMLALLASSIGMLPTVAVLKHEKKRVERSRGVKEIDELVIHLGFSVSEASERGGLFYVEYDHNKRSWRPYLQTMPFRYERTVYYVANNLFKSEAGVEREVETNALQRQTGRMVRDDVHGVISVKAAKIVPLL